MSDPTWVSILPPLLAIALAIWTRQVILSLFAGIWMGMTLLAGYNPFSGLAGSLDGIVRVFSNEGDARVLIFTLLIGSMVATIEHSGGVRGFVHFLEQRRWVHTGLRAQLMAWVTGLVIFIESNITLLVAGSVSRPLFDRFRISREKLAYLIDATSAPVCVMIPLNAWGAFIIGLVASSGVEKPLETFVAALPFNFYAIAAILLALVVIVWRVDIGPMKAAETRTREGQLHWPGATPMLEAEIDHGEASDGPPPSALHMVLPIVTMIAVMPLGLYVTGQGDMMAGSGSRSILWAVCAAIAVSWVMLLLRGESVHTLMQVFMKGAADLLPISAILLLALALGDVAQALGTGPFVAGAVGEAVPAPLLAPLVFLVAAFIAFSVGSSWGTFAIMVPIAIPIALSLDLSVPLFLAAAVSGGIFGDHASPISDTTVVASMASASDHIEHVRTQLPYALLAAAIAALGFFLAGLAG